MTPIYLLSAVLLAAMFLGADGNDAAGSLSLQDLEARCQKNLGLDLIPHPGECQLYYNCSHQQQQQQNHFTKYLQECPYPQLFSVATFRCQQFDEVACGHRLELVDKCDYLSHRHNNRGHSIPCYVNSPSCNWLPDGANVYQHRLWSPYYAICRSQRTVATGRCPTHKALGMTQLLHPKKRRCVSLYEIPKNHSGYEMTCTGKTDGLYMDDVTSRPDVFYSCLCGQLASVQRCPKGQYFDEWLATCSDSPLHNRITMAG